MSPAVDRLLPKSNKGLVNEGPFPGGGGIITGAALLASPAFPRRVPRSLRIFDDKEDFGGGVSIPDAEVPVNPVLLSDIFSDPRVEREGDEDTFKVDVGKALMDINDGILVDPEVMATRDCCGGGGGGGGGAFSPACSEIRKKGPACQICIVYETWNVISNNVKF